MLAGTERTRLGAGGPARAYGVFEGKAVTEAPATRITGVGLGGPWKAYGTFGAKSEDVDGASFNEFLITARRRGRR